MRRVVGCRVPGGGLAGWRSGRLAEWPAGVEGVVADPGVPDGLNEAAAGVDGVFLLRGYAAEAGLLATVRSKPVAVLSASSAVLGHGGNAMAAYHLATERAAQASDCPWTIVRPCSLQSNLLRWRDQLTAGDTIRASFADVAVAMLDPRDIAEIVGSALADGGHDGRTYRLSGPEALTPADQVALLAAALDRPLVCDPIPDDETVARAGPDYGLALVQIFRDHPELETDVQPTVPDLLGRPAGSLASWIDAHRSSFPEPDLS